MMKYKNYIAQVEYDDESDIFYGDVINTKDVITFQGITVKELKQAFYDSVDDYIDFCAARGEAPEKPFSGRFNLRLEPDLHREAYIAAKHAGMSLNSWVSNQIRSAARK